MNSRRFNQLVKQAARAERLGLGDYQQVMEQATVEAASDKQWEQFVEAVNKAVAVPLTPREQKQLANRKAREELEAAKRDAERSQRHYALLLETNKHRGH
jgi:hypothetical protein